MTHCDILWDHMHRELSSQLPERRSLCESDCTSVWFVSLSESHGPHILCVVLSPRRPLSKK